MTEPASSPSFARTFVRPAILLFALPALGYWFAGHADRRYDEQFLAAVEPAVESDPALSSAEKQDLKKFHRAFPLSVVCRSQDPQLSDYRQQLTDTCSDVEQFGWMRWLSGSSIALGLLSTLLALGSALASFVSRPLQYGSFVVGWLGLKLSGALQAVLQGGLAVFLSYWMTALWTGRYFPKLILVVGGFAAVAVFGVIKAIFTKPKGELTVEGELLPEARAPELWARIRQLCSKLDTAPPDQVVVGIDDNFFVTESEVNVGEQRLRGRTLYLSLSLLRILERSEADAVLAHEMAHFSGGDTSHSKRLAPLLARFTQYLAALHDGFITLPIFYFMRAYWGLFSLSMARSNRERELTADATAARATSSRDVAHSLIKVGAYASYRGRVEEALFDKDEQHAELGIAARVAHGFQGYAQSESLQLDLHHAVTPHPFDTHPALSERLHNVQVTLSADDYTQLLTRTVASSWVAAIHQGSDIEQRLWNAYEQRFAEAHQLALAYRYEPADDAERSHVEKYFPALAFEPKEDGPRVEMSYAGLSCSDWDGALAFEHIKSAQVEERMFKKYLDLRLQDGGLLGGKCSVCLSKLQQPDQLLEAFNRYYARDQVMRQHRAQREVEHEGASAA